MKLSAKQYAKTLYEITKDKSQSEIDEIIDNFVKFLVSNNQTKMAEKIIDRFKEISNEKEEIVEAEVTSREKLGQDLVDKLSSFVKEKYKAKKVIFDNKIDENILGGVIIRVKDEVLDGSVRHQLKNMETILKN